MAKYTVNEERPLNPNENANQGQRLFYDEHADIDWSRISITVISGSIQYQFRWRRWREWKYIRPEQGLSNRVDAPDTRDLWHYIGGPGDGDTDLQIDSLADNTRVYISYVSEDD